MRLIDTEVAALVLGCSVRQVQTLVTEGELTNHGAPRRFRLDLDEVTDRRMALHPRDGGNRPGARPTIEESI